MSHLEKNLSLLDLVSFGIACTVGAGIFVTAGEAVKQYVGSALFVSVMLAALSCLANGLCFAEMASKIPSAGGVYSYASYSFGPFMGYLMAWSLFLAYEVSGCVTARGFISYLRVFLDVPPWVNETVSPEVSVVIILLAAIAMTGAQESKLFTNFITLVNVVLMTSILVGGLFLFDWNNFGTFSLYGIVPGGTIAGAGIMFFSFMGFEGVTVLSEEVVNPEKNLPRGLLGTVAFTGVAYTAMAIVLCGMVSPDNMDINTPFSWGFEYHGWWIMKHVVSLGACTTTIATTYTCIVGQTRVLYRLSQDGEVPAIFSKLHNGVPRVGYLVVMVSMGAMAAVNSNELLVPVISIGTLASYSCVCACIIVCRDDRRSLSTQVFLLLYFLSVHALAFIIREYSQHRGDSQMLVGLGGVVLGVALVSTGWIIIKFSEIQSLAHLRVPLSNSGIVVRSGTQDMLYEDDSPARRRKATNTPKSTTVTSQRCLEKSFKCPGLPYVPLISIAINAAMSAFLDVSSVALCGGYYCLAALCFYFFR